MKYIMWFEEVGIGDVALVGGKNASLGEMISNLGGKRRERSFGIRHYGRCI